jgi:hypothetical protein
MLAARVEPKNGPNARQMLKALPRPSHPPAVLDQNMISGTKFKRQSGTPSCMITILGTSDHHHLEFVITIVWNG